MGEICNIVPVVHKPKLARENILWEPCTWGLNSTASTIVSSLWWCHGLGCTSRPQLPWPASPGASTQALSASWSRSSAWDRACQPGAPRPGLSWPVVSPCPVLTSAVSEQTPGMEPSPDSSPHLVWDCGRVGVPSPALLGSCRTKGTRETDRFLVSRN